MGSVIHCCLDVRGALAWPKRRLARLMRTESGRWASADEARDALLDEVAKGHRVIPIGEPCDGFSYETGCPGHATTPSDLRLPEGRATHMIKMPCLFVREFHGRASFTMTEQVTPGCEWVLSGEGRASLKRDGTACLFKDGALWKRYDAKKDRKTGEYKAPPAGAIPCADPDPVTGHWPHWAPLGPHDYWHVDAFERQRWDLVNGATYELCGPKLQGNPERFIEHVLIRHGVEGVPVDVRTFAGIRELLEALPHEGLVFAHPDGRYAKIRRADYGLPWPPPSNGTTEGGGNG